MEIGKGIFQGSCPEGNTSFDEQRSKFKSSCIEVSEIESLDFQKKENLDF